MTRDDFLAGQKTEGIAMNPVIIRKTAHKYFQHFLDYNVEDHEDVKAVNYSKCPALQQTMIILDMRRKLC